MTDIRIKMKDGTTKEFIDNGAPGGSYHQTLRYEINFVVIKDAYGKETSIPSGDIEEIQHEAERRI